MIKVIVADDERVARRRMVRLLREEPDITVIAECAGGRAAVEHIKAESPDLVLLDVQMPDLDGLGVIDAVGVERMPPVVFVTAFDQYAIRAFELHAVDYLLKPYDSERFREALSRARERLGRGRADGADLEQLRALLRDALVASPKPDGAGRATNGHREGVERLAVRINGGLRIVRTSDVDWFETDGNYIRLHVAGANHLIRSTAVNLESQLDPRRFVRIHRRFLVNLDRIVEVQPWFAGDAIVRLRDGTKLRLTRTYREQFHRRLLGEAGAQEAAPARR
jgi:two-component system, LytTR family, response regulator